LAIYSAHLPLDIHSHLGNNSQLAVALGFEQTTPFFEAKGQRVGLRIDQKICRNDLAQKLEHSLGGPVKTFAFGPAETKSIGLVTGGAGSEIYAVAREGIGRGRGARGKSSARWSLRDRNIWGESAGGASFRTLRFALAVHRFPHRIVRY
jgi:hypothetical protein